MPEPKKIEIKEVVADLATAFEVFKKTNDEALKEVKEGKEDVLTKEKVEKIDKALTALEDAKTSAEQRSDDIEKRLNRSELSGTVKSEDLAKEVKTFNGHRIQSEKFKREADVTEDEYKAYTKAFGTVLRKGESSLATDEERKALSVGVDTDGGYVVPAAVSARTITRIFETSIIRPLVSTETINTDAIEGLRDTDEASSGGWVSETGTRANTDTPELAKWRVPVHEMFAQPIATQQLLDDSSRDMEAWLSMKVADKFTRVENAAFVTGNGVGQPRGFASYTTAATADATRTWGQLEHVATGAAGDFAASNPADILFDLEAAFKPGYLNNATFATRRSVVTKLRKIKTSEGIYLWQPSIALGVPQTLLGYPIALMEDMAELADGSLSLALGDFRQAYTIVDRQGLRVIRDNLTTKPYVKFYTTRRVGGAVLQFEALKFLKFST